MGWVKESSKGGSAIATIVGDLHSNPKKGVCTRALHSKKIMISNA